MDGFEFLGEVRSETRRRIPTALKSGFSPEHVFQRGSRLGVEGYYPKQGREGRGMHELLISGFDRLLALRVEWLITAQPDVLRPRTSARDWVDMEALDALLRLDPRGAREDGQENEGSQVLRAPSPRAAVNALAVTVRDWFALYESGDAEKHRELKSPAPAQQLVKDFQINQMVRLGDEAIRRAAAPVAELHRTRILLALSCVRHGWWWRVAEGVHLTVDAPIEAHEEDGVYHCESGPALRYRDGWEVYALRGVLVPRHVVMQPEEITLEEIRDLDNAELRRVYRERFGEERYLRETGAEIIHVDTVPIDALARRGPHITRALLEDNEGRRFLVASDGSTRRVYHMEVPNDCQTCQEAYEQLSGRPGVRTIVQA